MIQTCRGSFQISGWPQLCAMRFAGSVNGWVEIIPILNLGEPVDPFYRIGFTSEIRDRPFWMDVSKRQLDEWDHELESGEAYDVEIAGDPDGLPHTSRESLEAIQAFIEEFPIAVRERVGEFPIQHQWVIARFLREHPEWMADTACCPARLFLLSHGIGDGVGDLPERILRKIPEAECSPFMFRRLGMLVGNEAALKIMEKLPVMDSSTILVLSVAVGKGINLEILSPELLLEAAQRNRGSGATFLTWEAGRIIYWLTLLKRLSPQPMYRPENLEAMEDAIVILQLLARN